MPVETAAASRSGSVASRRSARGRSSASADAAEHLRRANTRLALLNEIVTGLGGSTSRERAARAVIERLAGALDGIRVGFSSVRADGAIEARFAAGATDEPGAGGDAVVGATLVPVAHYHRALRRQELVTVADVRSDPLLGAATERLQADGIQALLAVGFPRTEELTDVLSFESPVPRAWSEEDASMLLEVAAYLFLALQEVGYQEERERAYADQSRTASRLTTLVESVQVGVLEEDEDRRISLVNQAFCDMFHLPPPEELIGAPTRETLRSTLELFVDPEAFVAGVDERIRCKERVLDEEIALADGRLLERDYLPGSSPEGFRGHFWVFRDITVHKETAEKARRSAERYRDFVENGVALAWSHDLEGRVLSANRSLAEAVGAPSPEDLVGRLIPEVVDPEYGQSWEEYIEEIREQGVARGRFRLRCFDGSKRILAFSNVLRKDENGQPVVRGFGENVTQHAEAEAALRRRSELEQRLVEISARLMSSTTAALGEAIAQCLDDIGPSLRSDDSVLFLLDESGTTLRAYQAAGASPGFAREAWPDTLAVAELPRAMAELGRLEPFRLRRPDELPAGASEELELCERLGLRSLLCVPVSTRGRLLGFVGLAGVEAEREWPDDEVAIVRVIGDILGGALERKRAEEELSAANLALAAANRVLEQTQRKMELLNEMGELLLTAREATEARSVLRTFLPRMFEGCSGSAHLQAPEPGETLDTVVTWGPSQPSPVPVAVDDCWALRRSRLHAVGGAGEGPACPHVEGEAKSLCIPLQANGNLLGLLHLRQARVRPAGVDATGLADLRQVAINTAEQISLGLWNLHLREGLRTQALEDPLTGLRNRRYLEERLSHELRRATRTASPVAVLMIDLDHFKRVNDLFGHAAGDRLLVRVARFLEGTVRSEDVVARYGGEEFTVILPGTRGPDARWVAEKLRKGARRLGSELAGDAGEARVTLSIGVAVHPEHGATVHDLLEVADAALYQAKREGRDRVLVAGENGMPEALGETG